MLVSINCIGAGRWGPNLIRLLATHPEARVGTVADLSEERLARVKRSIPWVSHLTTDPLRAIADPVADAIVIATPVQTHYELAKAALEAGKHVFVEKPLCPTVAEGEELVRLAEKRGKVLCVGHVFLFNPGIRYMAKLLGDGALGKVYYIHCTRTNLGPVRTDVNALWDLGAHDLSVINYWLGKEPAEVTAKGASYLNPGVADVVLASYTYTDGVMAHVHASWLNPRKVREIVVAGELKMAVWNDMDLNEPIRIYDRSVEAADGSSGYSDSFGSFRMLVRSGDVVVPNIQGGEPLATECEHFLDCIQGRAKPINGAASALAVLRALEAADESMKRNSAACPIRPAQADKPEGVRT